MGEPFAAHTDLGTVILDSVYSRIFSPGGVFTEGLVGKRIVIDGDIEKFRKVLSFVNSEQLIISGPPLTGTSTAKIWGDGPRVKVMADTYLYIPEIEVQSVVVDKRFFLVADEDTTGTKIYYTIAPGFSYGSIPNTGKLVLSEGTTDETIATVSSIGVDSTGAFLQMTDSISIESGTSLSYYDMSSITVGEDIEATPILYVLSVETLDPLSFELESDVPRTMPGAYDQAGYYISNTDPAEVFSARESKEIVLDTKEGIPAFVEINEGGSIAGTSSYFKGSTEVSSGENIIQVAGFDWTGLEGREISFTREAYNLTGSTVNQVPILSGAGTNEIVASGLDIDWLSNFGGRDDCIVLTFNSGGPSGVYLPGTTLVYGNRVELKEGNFSGGIDEVTVIVPNINADDPTTGTAIGPINEYAWNDGIFKQWDNVSSSWVVKSDLVDTTPIIPELVLEAVALEVQPDTTKVRISTVEPLSVNMSITSPTSSSDTSVIAGRSGVVFSESEEGNYSYRPVRVTYATHSAFSTIQDDLDDGDFGLTVKDDLIRSFFPTILDIPEIRYRGVSTAQEVSEKFLDIIQGAVEQAVDGESVKIDLSNIIGQLDEEGFTDAIDVDIEIRVTNFLDDGEAEVRYINPSEDTVQDLAIDLAVSPGDSTVQVVRTKTTADAPGRGKIFLGGNNPSTQEIIPYEAIIDNGDTLTVILRSGFTTQYSHPQWETATLSVRDYDPELEFKKGAIIIPANNRPYVRELNIIKERS